MFVFVFAPLSFLFVFFSIFHVHLFSIFYYSCFVFLFCYFFLLYLFCLFVCLFLFFVFVNNFKPLYLYNLVHTHHLAEPLRRTTQGSGRGSVICKSCNYLISLKIEVFNDARRQRTCDAPWHCLFCISRLCSHFSSRLKIVFRKCNFFRRNIPRDKL